MLFYGIELATGTTVKSLNCETGSAFPTQNLMVGRLFYNTTAPGALYSYNGSGWDQLGSITQTLGVTSFNNRTGAVTLSAADLPRATTSTLGGVIVGSGLAVTDGVISVSSSSVPAGSRLLWAQPAAPTGWTQITSTETSNRMLRVVNTVGGSTGSNGTGGYGYGGTDSPILNNKVPTHTHSFSGSVGAGGAHAHTIYTNNGDDPSNSGGNRVQNPGQGNQTWSTSTAPDHTHAVSGTISSNSGASNWTPLYLNLILCSKD